MYCALCDTVIVHIKTNKRTGFANRRAIDPSNPPRSAPEEADLDSTENSNRIAT